MVAFPAVWAFTYVSASFWSVSRLHSALAFAAKAKPARTIEQDMMMTFTLLIDVSPLPVRVRQKSRKRSAGIPVFARHTRRGTSMAAHLSAWDGRHWQIEGRLLHQRRF
jgi:hypothetical protein